MRVGKIVMKVMSSHVRGRIVLLALSAVIIGLLVLPGCGLAPAPEVGYPAPDFNLTDLAGNTVRLSDFRGKVVLLNFWAITCPPCRAEMPAMEEVYQEYKDKDVVIIGVDLDGPVSVVGDYVRDYVEVNGYSWTFVIDTIYEVARDYLVTNIPASFFIDKDGIIRALQVGAMSKTTMETKLARTME